MLSFGKGAKLGQPECFQIVGYGSEYGDPMAVG